MGDLLAVGIQQLAGEVLGLANDQRERGADHGVPTFLGDVDQPAPHDFEPDGVVLDARHRLFERHARRHHRLKGRGLADCQAQVQMVIHRQRVAGWQDGGRFPFLDDRRTGDILARFQRIAVVNRDIHVASGIGEIGLPAAFARLAACVGPRLAGHVDLRRRSRAQYAPVQGVDSRAFIKMGVEPGIDFGERGRHVGHVAFAKRLARQRNLNFVHLTEEPHIGGEGNGDVFGGDAGLRQQPPSFRLQVGEQVVDRAEVHLFDQAGQRARTLEADRRDQEAERRRGPRRRRHDELPHPQLARHPRRMGGSGAAQRHHGVAPGVVALLDDMDPRRACHVLAHDLIDSPRRLHRRQAQGFADSADRHRRGRSVQRHPAAQEEVRIEIAEHEIGVGNRRLRSPVSITGRTRVGAGAAGTHLQEAQVIDARDRPATGTDFDHVDDRRLYRQAAALLEAMDPRRLHHRGDVGTAILDQAGLRRRSAHVERDDVRLAHLDAEVRRRHASAGRPGFQESHGKRCRDRWRRQASGRLHEVKLAVKPLCLEGLHQAPHVAPRQGLHVGVRHRRRCPIKFPQLRLHGA